MFAPVPNRTYQELVGCHWTIEAQIVGRKREHGAVDEGTVQELTLAVVGIAVRVEVVGLVHEAGEQDQPAIQQRLLPGQFGHPDSIRAEHVGLRVDDGAEVSVRRLACGWPEKGPVARSPPCSASPPGLRAAPRTRPTSRGNPRRNTGACSIRWPCPTSGPLSGSGRSSRAGRGRRASTCPPAPPAQRIRGEECPGLDGGVAELVEIAQIRREHWRRGWKPLQPYPGRTCSPRSAAGGASDCGAPFIGAGICRSLRPLPADAVSDARHWWAPGRRGRGCREEGSGWVGVGLWCCR